jgi:hypothetical protein
MPFLFLKPPPASGASRALATVPGNPDQFRAAAEDVGASLGPLQPILAGLGKDHVVSVSALRTALQAFLVRVEKYRTANRFSPEPHDPDDPSCPEDDGENARAWYLFTQGKQLAEDLASLLEYLEKVAGFGVEEITIKAQHPAGPPLPRPVWPRAD